MPEDNFQPRILSHEEIEMYVKGNREEVDRLILFSLNRISSVLIPHAQREDAMMSRMEQIGGFDAITKRAEYVDELITKSKSRTKMMDKVNQSAVTWALIAFLGFLAHAVWQDVIEAIRTASAATKVLKP